MKESFTSLQVTLKNNGIFKFPLHFMDFEIMPRELAKSFKIIVYSLYFYGIIVITRNIMLWDDSKRQLCETIWDNFLEKYPDALNEVDAVGFYDGWATLTFYISLCTSRSNRLLIWVLNKDNLILILCGILPFVLWQYLKIAYFDESSKSSIRSSSRNNMSNSNL